MITLEAQEGVPWEHVFKTTATSHEHDPETHHHHSYEYEMEMTITTYSGEVFELYNTVGMHEGELADGTIIIAISVDDPTVFGHGAHSWNIKATNDDGLILSEQGQLIVKPRTGTPTPEHEVRPWDLLNPNSGRVSKLVRNERLSVCQTCPELTLGMCNVCKCIMRWKTTLADATCPLGKW